MGGQVGESCRESDVMPGSKKVIISCAPPVMRGANAVNVR